MSRGIELADEEIARLKRQWHIATSGSTVNSAQLDGIISTDEIDRFDQATLIEGVQTCRESRSLSEAGRKLFAVSRLSKAKRNGADRLRKYLARFGLNWEQVKQVLGSPISQLRRSHRVMT